MKRPLSRFRLFVCVPLGALWLGVMAVTAIPVILFMTVLYYLLLLGRALTTVREAPRDAARRRS